MKTYRQEGNNSLLIINYKTSAKIKVNNIVLMKSDANYSTFYLDGGQEKLVSHSIKFYEEHLENYGFLRIHRRCIINPNYVKQYNPNEESITMKNGQKVIVSRRRKHLLKDFKVNNRISE